MFGVANDEVVHAHPVGLASAAPRAAAVLEIADQLLPLRVDRDRRLSAPLGPLDGLGKIAKLRVPIRMLTAFAGLDVALQGVPQLVQQVGDDGVADRVASGRQRDRQRPALGNTTAAGVGCRRVSYKARDRSR